MYQSNTTQTLYVTSNVIQVCFGLTETIIKNTVWVCLIMVSDWNLYYTCETFDVMYKVCVVSDCYIQHLSSIHRMGWLPIRLHYVQSADCLCTHPVGTRQTWTVCLTPQLPCPQVKNPQHPLSTGLGGVHSHYGHLEKGQTSWPCKELRNSSVAQLTAWSLPWTCSTFTFWKHDNNASPIGPEWLN